MSKRIFVGTPAKFPLSGMERRIAMNLTQNYRTSKLEYYAPTSDGWVFLYDNGLALFILNVAKDIYEWEPDTDDQGNIIADERTWNWSDIRKDEDDETFIESDTVFF